MKKIILVLGLFLIFSSFVSAISVDADYITIYPGEEGKISIEIINNEKFDIEDVSLALSFEGLGFSSVGSSEKTYDDIDEDDDESESFTIKASSNIVPGDYDIPYVLKYTNEENDSESYEKTGSFGIRVSAKTDLEFSAEASDAIVGTQGKIRFSIINKGLGEIKSVIVEVSDSQGFDVLSSEKIFIGNVGAEDDDSVSFDALFNSKSAKIGVKVTYKDFENKDQIELIELPLKVYSQEEALELGLIKKNNTWIYVGVIIVLFVIWFVYRKIKKSKKKKKE